MKPSYGCPVELSLDLVKGKWKTVILARLKQGPMTYGELRRAIPKLADKMLTQRLKDLETDGFVRRTGKARGYELSAEGHTLTPILEALYSWGREAAVRKGATFEGGAVFPPLKK